MAKGVKMILTNGFGPDVRVYKEAQYLKSLGMDVEILCWDRQGEFAEFEIVDGIKVKRFFPYAQYGTGYRQFFAYCRFIRECKRYLRDKEYKYLHCHDLDGIIAGWFAKEKDAKLIFDMHEFYEAQGRRKQRLRYLIRAIVGFFQSKADYIIHVNDVQTASVSKSNSQKLVFLPNYPQRQYYQGCEKTSSEKLRISYIGAVRQYQRLKMLMDACRNMDDVEVSIHGAGVAFEALKKDEKAYSNVKVTGRYHFKESAKLYSDADVSYVIYSTTSEQYLTAYPVKFFEAIVTKTPPIVGEKTVLANLVKEKDIGFVVNGDDLNSVRELVNTLRQNRELLEEKMINLEKIRFDYCWETVVTNLDRIYTE